MKSFTHHDNPLVENRPDEPEVEQVQINHWWDLPSFSALNHNKDFQRQIYDLCSILLDTKRTILKVFESLKKSTNVEHLRTRKNAKLFVVKTILIRYSVLWFGDENALDSYFEELDHFQNNGGE